MTRSYVYVGSSGRCTESADCLPRRNPPLVRSGQDVGEGADPAAVPLHRRRIRRPEVLLRDGSILLTSPVSANIGASFLHFALARLLRYDGREECREAVPVLRSRSARQLGHP